jgi:hypothetical protein
LAVVTSDFHGTCIGKTAWDLHYDSNADPTEKGVDDECNSHESLLQNLPFNEITDNWEILYAYDGDAILCRPIIPSFLPLPCSIFDVAEKEYAEDAAPSDERLEGSPVSFQESVQQKPLEPTQSRTALNPVHSKRFSANLKKHKNDVLPCNRFALLLEP